MKNEETKKQARIEAAQLSLIIKDSDLNLRAAVENSSLGVNMSDTSK